MTLNVRRILLTILLIPAIAGMAVVAFSWTMWSQGAYTQGYGSLAQTARWWTIWTPAFPVDLPWALAGISFFTGFPLLFELFFRRRFGRSPSPEIFFLRVFLLTLPLQASRIAILFVLAGSFPVSVGLIATRIAWFGRFLGLASLLNVGLFTTDIPFRRSGPVLGMGALAAMAIVVMMPLDVTQPLGNLLYRPGTNLALSLVSVSMELLAVLSLVGTALVHHGNHYFVLAMTMLLIVAGTDMAFFLSRPLIVPGAILVLLGVMIFARKIRKIYQWI